MSHMSVLGAYWAKVHFWEKGHFWREKHEVERKDSWKEKKQMRRKHVRHACKGDLTTLGLGFL
jgi:hypothetical protein